MFNCQSEALNYNVSCRPLRAYAFVVLSAQVIDPRVVGALWMFFARNIFGGGHIHVFSEITAMRHVCAVTNPTTQCHNGHLMLAERVQDAIE